MGQQHLSIFPVHSWITLCACVSAVEEALLEIMVFPETIWQLSYTARSTISQVSLLNGFPSLSQNLEA
jgi:hypothetical protein